MGTQEEVEFGMYLFGWGVGVAPIEEKLIQHRFRWFRYVQRRPPEVLVCSALLKRVDNIKRGRD